MLRGGRRNYPPRRGSRSPRDAVDNGMVFLLLTGGEVFLRRDFFEIYTPLTHWVSSSHSSPTARSSPKRWHRLAQAPPNRTEITLYGATAATYEAVTGVPGSYAHCCAELKRCQHRARSD